MKRSKFSDLDRAHGITEQTYCRWKSKDGGLELSEPQRLRQLEDENRRGPAAGWGAGSAAVLATAEQPREPDGLTLPLQKIRGAGQGDARAALPRR
jgi:hypothetical protein